MRGRTSRSGGPTIPRGREPPALPESGPDVPAQLAASSALEVWVRPGWRSRWHRNGNPGVVCGGGAGRPDRAAGLGDHRAARRRRAPGRWPVRPVHREGLQGPRHAADPPDHSHHARLARRTRRRRRRPGFPGPDGKPLGTDAVRRLTQRHATTAAARCPSLSNKKVSPPTLRHTSAMRMLESGIDLATISLWLGYFSGVPDLSGSARRNRPAGPRQKPFCLPCTTGKL